MGGFQFANQLFSSLFWKAHYSLWKKSGEKKGGKEEGKFKKVTRMVFIFPLHKYDKRRIKRKKEKEKKYLFTLQP